MAQETMNRLPPGQLAPSELSLIAYSPSSPSKELTFDTMVDIQPRLSTSISTRAQKAGRSKKIASTGPSLTLEDFYLPKYSSPDDGSQGDSRDAVINPQLLLGSNLPSTDPDDLNFFTGQDLLDSTTKIYSWNYLERSGRHDSNVDSAWIHNNTEVGRDLIDFRDRVIQENGGLTEPHEKL
ncbi:hypothetical protein BGX26_002123, partial [Mortierella sp. AD094]